MVLSEGKTHYTLREDDTSDNQVAQTGQGQIQTQGQGGKHTDIISCVIKMQTIREKVNNRTNDRQRIRKKSTQTNTLA